MQFQQQAYKVTNIFINGPVINNNERICYVSKSARIEAITILYKIRFKKVSVEIFRFLLENANKINNLIDNKFIYREDLLNYNIRQIFDNM